MFRLKPCPPDFVDSAPAHFDNQAVVCGTPEQVFDVVTAIEHEGAWFPDFKQAHWTAGPPGPGATRDYRLTYLRLIEHFAIWQRGKHLAFWVSGASLPLVTRFVEDYRFTPTADGRTHLRWRVAYQPSFFLRPLHPMLRPLFARDFRRATANLVAYCRRLYGPGASAGLDS